MPLIFYVFISTNTPARPRRPAPPPHFPTLAHFCGKRDLKSLTQTDLMSVFNIPKADALVLFGGSILTGGDLLANPLYAF